MNQELPPQPEKDNSAERGLEEFRREIKAVANKELASGNAHFNESFNPDELDANDMALYEKFKVGQLNVPELWTRGNELAETLNPSQKLLVAYIVNALQRRVMEQR